MTTDAEIQAAGDALAAMIGERARAWTGSEEPDVASIARTIADDLLLEAKARTPGGACALCGL
jgi:hypothetical protein